MIAFFKLIDLTTINKAIVVVLLKAIEISFFNNWKSDECMGSNTENKPWTIENKAIIKVEKILKTKNFTIAKLEDR